MKIETKEKNDGEQKWLHAAIVDSDSYELDTVMLAGIEHIITLEDHNNAAQSTLDKLRNKTGGDCCLGIDSGVINFRNEYLIIG